MQPRQSDAFVFFGVAREFLRRSSVLVQTGQILSIGVSGCLHPRSGRRELNDDFDVAGPSFQSLFETLRLFMVGYRTAERISVGSH